MFAPKKILVPTDFSVYADNALKVAIEIARQNKARIYLLHVVDVAYKMCSVDYCLDDDLIKKVYDDNIKNAKEKLKQEVKRVSENNSGVEITFDIKTGIPGEEILDEQEKQGIDLIVIASHGKTGILKNMMGNVVDKVSKRAKCNVLVLRK